MSSSLPEYYSGLGPFRSWFGAGVPILMYHKLGPRPRGARLKGLTVGAPLFERQLAELRAAGFQSALPGNLRLGADNASRQIVITFDDGFQNVLEYGLEPLAAHGFQAIQFLVADALGKTNAWDAPLGEVQEPIMDAPAVRDWLKAGHQIGAHSLSHPYLTRLETARAREEIVSSKSKLEDLFGLPIRHFCYPYGDWNASVHDLVCEAGYETACTTDWGLNTAATDRLALKRIMGRYPSRGLRAMLGWLRRRLRA